MQYTVAYTANETTQLLKHFLVMKQEYFKIKDLVPDLQQIY